MALIHEGLLTYFPHEQKRKILNNFRSILGSKDAWLTPDVITHKQMERTTSLSREYLDKWPTFHTFEDEAEAQAMMKEAGFTVEILSPMELVPHLKCEVLGERVREILAHEQLWVMRLR
jgi:O-methyltransferase involved in polyketide biosynthesis